MAKKSTAPNRKVTEQYNRIINTFPDLPPYTLKSFNYPMLSAKYEMFKDKKSLELLQQQSWLSSFFMEYSKTSFEAIKEAIDYVAVVTEEATT